MKKTEKDNPYSKEKTTETILNMTKVLGFFFFFFNLPSPAMVENHWARIRPSSFSTY